MKKFSTQVYINIIVFALISAYALVNMHETFIHEENGFLEDWQVVYFALSAIVYFAAFLKNDVRGRLIPLFFSTLCIAFIFREIEFQEISNNETVVKLCSGKGRNIIMAVMISSVLIAASFRFKIYFSETLKWFRSKTGVLFIIFGIIQAGVSVFEELEKKQIFHFSEFAEEYSETWAVLFLFLSALAYLKSPGILSKSYSENRLSENSILK